MQYNVHNYYNIAQISEYTFISSRSFQMFFLRSLRYLHIQPRNLEKAFKRPLCARNQELSSSTVNQETANGVLSQLIGKSEVRILTSVPDVLELIRRIALSKNEQGKDDPFMLVNLDEIFNRFNLWKKELPMIEPFYAVKCNTDQVLLRTLAALGTGFDCASKEEIDTVLNMDVTADRVIFANSCKSRSFISHANDVNVSMMTFDSAEELAKVAKLHPNAELILRIAVSDPTADWPLSIKFGAEPENAAPQLIRKAKELGVKVIGISFHVGSSCNDPTAFRTAIMHAKNLTDVGRSLGFDMKLVDIGGGFPGWDDVGTSFKKIAKVIRSAMDEFFDGTNIRFIAEPGRFFAGSPFTLAANVIHSTEVPADKITKNASDSGTSGYMYYLNDGIYGSFSCVLFDPVMPLGTPLFDEHGEEFISIIWGPTCDSLDKIEDNKIMRRLSIGDWILYPHMGAYTTAASTTFNGFRKPTPIYVISKEKWAQIWDSCHV